MIVYQDRHTKLVLFDIMLNIYALNMIIMIIYDNCI